MKKLIEKIKEIAENYDAISSVMTGDILSNTSKRNLDYPCLNIDIVSSNISLNTATHNIRLYAFDRTNDDNSNALDIQSDMFSVLEYVIRTLAFDNEDEINYGVTPGIFNPFQQKFSDYLAGQFVDISVVAPELDC